VIQQGYQYSVQRRKDSHIDTGHRVFPCVPTSPKKSVSHAKMERTFVNVLVRLGYHVTGLVFFKQGMFG
jgi:hypothetical protein